MDANSENLRLLKKELPWVTEFIPKDVGNFFVYQMDDRILNQLVAKNSWVDGKPHNYLDDIFLVDKLGQKIGTVGVVSVVKPVSEFVWWPPHFVQVNQTANDYPWENVSKTLGRLGEAAENMRYIVRIHSNDSCLSSSRLSDFYIYKVPKTIIEIGILKWLYQRLHQKHEEIPEYLDRILNKE